MVQRGDLARLDAVAFLGQRGLAAVTLGVVDLHSHLVAANGLQLRERGSKFSRGLHIVLGHRGANEGVDLHRPLDFQVADQLEASEAKAN